MEGDNNDNNKHQRSILNRLLNIFCLGKIDEEENDDEGGFDSVPRPRRLPRTVSGAFGFPAPSAEEEKLAKEAANERRRMFVGPNLPFFMCLRRQQENENIELQNVAGSSNEESLESQAGMIRVAGPPVNNSDFDGRSITLHRDSVKLATQPRRKRRLASRRTRTFSVPHSSTQEPPEIYDISVTYSPSDDEN